MMECGAHEFTIKVINCKISELAAYEKCTILRRRSNKHQKDIAKEIGLTRYSINQMEIGVFNSRKLVEYWVNNAG